jgi:hypothetical protein
MNDKVHELNPKSVLLTRSEAARYVGLSGESAIRAAEDRGLETAVDASGQVWLSQAVLDAWKWRTKLPSKAKRAAVLRQAARNREREARERRRQEDADMERELAEWDADLRRYDQEGALRAQVRQKANEQRAAFELAHMDERTAGMALGFESYEARGRVRDLVRRGLLRRVESPPEPRVEYSFDGMREVQSGWPLVHGGPFIPREDVLRLRQETFEAAAQHIQRAPAAVQASVASSPLEAVLGDFLSALLDAARNGEK